MPEPLPTILEVAALPARLRNMIGEIWRHRDVLLQYESGALVLHWQGASVKPQLDKVGLNGSSAPAARVGTSMIGN